MRIDLFHTLVNPGRTRPWSELLEMSRARAELADELGYGGIWFGEHHFDVQGADQCPNPVMLASDLAARTSRLRIGLAAVTLPLWHPVRLAEDLAMLDHFAGGRLEVAFSRGILPNEIVNLNPDADRRNEQRSRAIFAEHLEIVRRAWTEDPFSWAGERYTLPQPGLKALPAEAEYAGEDGELVGLAVLPQPVQRPAPPLYSVTESREGFLSAARDGLGVITWYPTRKVLEGLFEDYRHEVGRISGATPELGAGCAALRICCVAPTDEEARRIIEPSVDRMFDLIKRVRGLQVWLDAGEDPEDRRLEGVYPFDLLLERDHLMVGSPESVAGRINRMAADHGVRHLLLQCGSGGVADEHVERSMRLVAEEVMPAVGASSATRSA